MTTERCECCDLPAYSCGWAKEAEQRRAENDRRAELTQRGWIKAAYPGQCAACRNDFPADSLILYSYGLNGWIADCCPDGER